MANGDSKTIQFTISLPTHLVELLDWLTSEQESRINRSEMLANCLEEKIHKYVLEKRPDLAKKTSIVKKQAFFRELSAAIESESNG